MNPAKLWRMNGRRVAPATAKKTGLDAEAKPNPASYCQKWRWQGEPRAAWQGRRGKMKEERGTKC